MFSDETNQSRQDLSTRGWCAARQLEFKDRPSCP
jgi:hypothetical protein